MGALQFARSWYCAEWSGTVSLRLDSDYRHKQESFKPNEMCGSPRSRDTGLFCLIMSFQQRDFGRVASTGALQQGATAGVHQQGYINRGPRQGCFGRVSSAGGFGRGTSTFSKYYEFPVTINGNIRLYCGTTRKRRQEKEKEDKKKKKKTRERRQEKDYKRKQ